MGARPEAVSVMVRPGFTRPLATGAQCPERRGWIMPYTYEDLLAIQAADPDGGERQPTKADYAAHEAWAVRAFGQDAWDRYCQPGWGREPGYHDGGVYDGYDGDDF
jgi:hypothetical protein